MEDTAHVNSALSAELSACALCNSRNTLKRCSRCRKVYYCSREHQREDWIRHKTECRHTESTQSSAATCLSFETGDHTRRNTVVDDNQAEIESILDFSTISTPNKVIPQTSEEKKEIFFELATSDSNYAGPSDDADASYTNIVDTFCSKDLNRQIDNNREAEKVDLVDNTLHEEIPLFNSHPFRRLKFPKPESYDLPDVAYFVSLRLTQLGYCVLDDALDESLIEGIISEVESYHQKNEFIRGDTFQHAGDTGYRNDMIKWLDTHSEGNKHISQGLSYIDSLIELLQPHVTKYCDVQGRTDVMLACYPKDGSYFRRHIDNESKDGRRITCTLYLNRDWDIQRDGGLMRMFPPKQDKPVDVPPLTNRLLFFWSDQRTPHEIHPCYKDRYSITVWYYDKEEKEASKVQKLKRETEDIYERISALEEQRMRLQEMTSTQQIRNRAMEAVQALTPGELQALGILIDHHPDPKAALTAMGISETIQDALIVHLSSQDSGST